MEVRSKTSWENKSRGNGSRKKGKKLTSLVLIFSMLLFLAVPFASAETTYLTGEVLVNGSIEEVNPDDATDAIAWDQSGAVASTDFRTGTGSRSLKLKSTTGTEIISASQDFKVVAGETYNFWFKTYEHTDIGGDARKSEVIVSYLDINGLQVGADNIIRTYDAVNRPGVWAKTETPVVIPEGTDAVRVDVYAENFTGTYYYDLFSFSGAIPPSDVPLAAPTDLTATAISHEAVDLSWTASEGDVFGYKIHRDGLQIADVSVTTFSDTGLTGSTEYSYTVEAYSPNEPSASSTVTVTTPAPPAEPTIAAPTGLTAVAVSHQAIDLSWTAATGTVTGYKVHRDGVQVGDVTGTTFSDTGLVASTEYSYTVEAYNASESATSEAVAATTLEAPFVYETGELLINGSFEEVNPDDTSDAIAWEQDGTSASTDWRTGTGSRSLKVGAETADKIVSAAQEVKVVSGEQYKLWYKIYYGSSAGDDRKTEVIVSYLDADGVQVGEDLVMSSYDTVNMPGVWTKTEKYFTVPEGADKVRVFIYAQNVTGYYYYDLFSLTGAIPVALTAPTDVTVDAVTYAGATLSWTASEGAVEGYRILRDDVQVGDVLTTSFGDTGLTASTEYSYVVEAYSGSETQASAAVTLTTAAGPIVNGEQLLNSNFEFFEEVTLKPLDWITSEGVISTDEFRRHGTRSLMMKSDNLENIATASQEFSVFSQHIYKFRGFFHDPNGVGDAKNPERVSEVTVHYFDAAGQEIGADVLARFDKFTTNTAVYKEILREFSTPAGTREVRLRMHAENYVGFFLYDWFQLSLIGAAPNSPQPPEAPAKVVGTVTSETTVDVSWTAVTSGNVNSYNVYRDGVVIGSSTVNSYADSGLTADTAYSYTVTAINENGESEHSPATVVITTFYNDTTPPTKPVLHADAESSTKIVLRWKGVDDDVRVADHIIYRNGVLLKDSGIIMGVYEDKNLTPGTTYNYEVIARDSKGNESEISNTAYATTFDTDAISDYVEGVIQFNYYINEANADAIYRLGPGYVGEGGLTAHALVHLPDNTALVFSQTITDTRKTVISIPISSLAVGQYSVDLSITDGNQIIWATEDDILKNPPAPGDTRVVQVDHDREIMLVDGAPYYPLGAFGVDEDSLQQLADAGFNTTLRWKGYTTWPSYNMELSPDDPYNVDVVSSYLDAVQAAGLYAFESPVKLAEEKYYHNYKDPNWDSKYPIHNDIITPGVLHTAATHPAVIGYYSYDEVDNFYECCPTQSDSVVMQHGVEEWYDIVKELDPYHTVMTLFAVGLSKNADWSAWDLPARDYYFNDTKHMSDVYEVMRQSAITADEWNDPFIATPLLEESSAQRKPLNGIQQRANTYASVIAGARGLYYWDWAAVYNDNWDMLNQVIGEVNELQPILTERIPLQSIVYSDGTVQNSNSGMSNTAQAMVTNHNNKTYLITVNTENAPIQVTFTLPAEHSGIGSVWFEDREIEVVNGTFTDTYEPYARHVYELQGTWVEGSQITLDASMTGAETVYVDPEYAPNTKNMLLNTSFEESYGSTPGIPAHWFNGDSPMNSGQTGSDGEWHVDDDEFYHGNASMRLTEKEGGIFDDIFMFQVPGIMQGNLEFKTAGTYTYSVWMKADREDVTVTLQETWGTFENVQVGTEWARYEVQIEKSGAGGGFAAIWVMDQGTVWIDAIQMELAATATDYEAPVLTNPDTYTGSIVSVEAPAAPTELAATEIGRNHVDLSWTASVDEVVGYVIYRDDVEVGTSETNTYSDTGLTAATEYSYTVKAINSKDLLSENSNEVIVTTLDPASFESLAGLIAAYLESGDISHNVGQQLKNKLKQAVKFDEEGKTAQEEKFLNDLIKVLNNPGQQKNISAESKEVLLSEIEQLITMEIQ